VKTFPRRMFICLPVRSLARSMAFFASLNFRFDPSLTDGCAACVIVNPNACAILLQESSWYEGPAKLSRFSGIVGISCASREEVDEFCAKAIAGGGSVNRPALDLGFLYSAALCDLDGYTWEAVWTHSRHSLGAVEVDRLF
jgi:predicted lactoylglutathione lyase